MPRLRFHNLNNGTNNRIGSEDITSTALLIFCAVVVLIPVTGIATFTWYMPLATTISVNPPHGPIWTGEAGYIVFRRLSASGFSRPGAGNRHQRHP